MSGGGLKPEIRRLPPEVIEGFVEHAQDLKNLAPGRLFLLACSGGLFIGMGALLSVALSSGVEQAGVARLLLGLGFATGFMLVILTGGALLTEINVVLPQMMFARGELATRENAAFWGIVALGNIVGLVFIGGLFELADAVRADDFALLSELVDEKMRFQDDGARGWLAVVASGVIGNWLVGMAAFLATAARTVPGKIMGVLFPVVAFVAIGVQHSPANLGYFSIAQWHGGAGYGWGEMIWWNLIPAALGNLLGAATLVAGLLWITHGRAAD